MKLLQINVAVNTGSHGRIAEEIGLSALANGYKSYIAAAYINCSQSEVIKIGSKLDRILHGLKTRLFDEHGFGSVNATKRMVRDLEEINPDIIHLHNIHGYYVNILILFEYLKRSGKPIIWTLHDCWPFTGHCSHFERIGCDKWKTHCFECPNKKGYPGSWWIDNSKDNFSIKQNTFTNLKNLHIVTPSRWLAELVSNSFLKDYKRYVIPNGIDTETFKIIKDVQIRDKYNLKNYKIILGAANTWKRRRALEDFISLSRLIQADERIVLLGIKQNNRYNLPPNIIPISRTEDRNELASFYSAASVFVNPTYVDNFPTTNLESLACGTPVISYNTGGSPESIDDKTGIVVEKGNIVSLSNAIKKIILAGNNSFSDECRKRALNFYDKNDRFKEYLNLYEKILNEITYFEKDSFH